MLSALRIPGVRWIVALHAADLLLEFASSVALMVLVYEVTDSPVAASLMLVAKQVAPGALAATLGRLLDSVDVRTGLVAAYLSRAAVFVLLAGVGTGPALYALAFAAGAAGVASRVFIRASVVRATTGRVFREITAVQNVSFGAVALLGPALGALAAGVNGPGASIAGWGVFALALAATACTIPASLRHRVQVPVADDTVAAEDAPAAARSSLRAPLWSLLALGGTLTCVFSMDEPALLAYSRDALGGDVATYGTILVTWGLGMLLGGVAYGRYGVGAPFGSIVAGVLAAALGYVGLGFAPSISAALGAAVIGGAGNGIFWVALATAVLEGAPAGEEAKASGRFEGMATAMPAIGFLLGGVFAQYVSPRVTLWLPGLVAIAVLGAWTLLAVRAARVELAAAPPGIAPAGSPEPATAVRPPAPAAPAPAPNPVVAEALA